MKVQDLKPGLLFKLPQNKVYKTVVKTIELKEYDHISPFGRKILVITDGCEQHSILKDTEVDTRCVHHHPDGSDAYKYAGSTHREMYRCEICGETTNA